MTLDENSLDRFKFIQDIRNKIPKHRNKNIHNVNWFTYLQIHKNVFSDTFRVSFCEHCYNTFFVNFSTYSHLKISVTTIGKCDICNYSIKHKKE